MESILSRLNASTQSFDMRIGGIPSLTPEMVAHACKGLSATQQNIIYALVGYKDYRETIRLWFYCIAMTREWGKTKAQREVISNLAINAVLPDKKCPLCKGRRETPDDKQVMVGCPKCNQKGVIEPTPVEKAEMFSMSKSAYYRQWHPRYAYLLRRYDGEYGDAMSKIKGKLK